jgi:5-methylcytosine-specific restriction endonuclease McrA
MPRDPYYNTRDWHDLRIAALRRDLWTCVVPGCGQPAYAVDHIIARRAGGTDTLENVRSLCKAHDHSVKETHTGERANAGQLRVKGCYADGSPRDPSHPWFRGPPEGVQSSKPHRPATGGRHSRTLT